MRAAEVMTRDVVTLTPETPASEAADVLSRAHIHGAPVVDHAGRLVGIVSVVDLVTPVARTVQGVMAWNPITAEEDTPLKAVAALMLEHQVRRIPIVRGDKVVGIVSASDVVHVFLAPHTDVGS